MIDIDDDDKPEVEPCWSCMGTGIGRYSQDSTCAKCSGRGYIKDDEPTRADFEDIYGEDA